MIKQRIHKLLLMSAAITLVGCGHKEATVTQSAIPVRVTQVCTGTVENNSYYVGTIEEQSATDISFESSGRVTNIYVQEGQYVTQGTLLAEIDNRNATNAYNAAHATLMQAQDGYERAKKVYDKGSLPEVKWIEVQTQLNQAKSVEDMARKSLDECQLRAPVSGTISDRNIEVGTSVSPLMPVMTILDLSNMRARFNVPEIDVDRVHSGNKAQVTISALGNKVMNGYVEEVGVIGDALAHSYEVTVILNGGKSSKLRPGMVCKVQLPSIVTHKGLEIPNRAVQLEHDGRRFVWIAAEGEDGTLVAEQRFVKIGDLSTHGVIIAEGLNEGDRVVIDGMLKLSSGMRVEIVD